LSIDFDKVLYLFLILVSDQLMSPDIHLRLIMRNFLFFLNLLFICLLIKHLNLMVLIFEHGFLLQKLLQLVRMLQFIRLDFHLKIILFKQFLIVKILKFFHLNLIVKDCVGYLLLFLPVNCSDNVLESDLLLREF